MTNLVDKAYDNALKHHEITLYLCIKVHLKDVILGHVTKEHSRNKHGV